MPETPGTAYGASAMRVAQAPAKVSSFDWISTETASAAVSNVSPVTSPGLSQPSALATIPLEEPMALKVTLASAGVQSPERVTDPSIGFALRHVEAICTVFAALRARALPRWSPSRAPHSRGRQS